MIAKIRAALRRKLVVRLNAPDMPLALEGLRRRGFRPELIFDVGAFRGEFARMVLGVWPAARVAGFEPLRHGRAEIKELRQQFPRIDLHETLVGATEKASVEMHVANSSSSLLRDADTGNYPTERF